MLPGAIALQGAGAGSELWQRRRLSTCRKSSPRGLTGSARVNAAVIGLSDNSDMRRISRCITEARHIDEFLNIFRSRRHRAESPISMAIARSAICAIRSLVESGNSK